jgi:hypothetical protein
MRWWLVVGLAAIAWCLFFKIGMWIMKQFDNDTSKELIEFDCELLNETPKAYKVCVMLSRNKQKEFWAGKTIAEVISNKNGTKLSIQRWVAEKEGLL